VIARLAGQVAEKGDDRAVIDVGGVGYLVHLSAGTLSALPPTGERVVLRIHTNVSQDAISLYGFLDEDEERVFHALLSVSRVGPKAAQNILSGISPRELAAAVAHGDVARMSQVKGVGKKTAERLVVELKDRLAALALGAAGARSPEKTGVLDQLDQALVGLGFKPQQAEKAVEMLGPDAESRDLDELLREALKLLRG
jgi:Holliday junction DNA helicase RuvA